MKLNSVECYKRHAAHRDHTTWTWYQARDNLMKRAYMLARDFRSFTMSSTSAGKCALCSQDLDFLTIPDRELHYQQHFDREGVYISSLGAVATNDAVCKNPLHPVVIRPSRALSIRRNPRRIGRPSFFKKMILSGDHPN